MDSAAAAAFVTAVDRADAGRLAGVDLPCPAAGVRLAGVLGFPAGFGASEVGAFGVGAFGVGASGALASGAVDSPAAGSAAPRAAAVPPRVVDLAAPVPVREVVFLAGARTGVGEPNAWSAADCGSVAAGSTGAGSAFLVRGARAEAACEPPVFASAAARGARGVDARAFDGALGSLATAALEGSAVVFSSGFESTG